MAGVIIDGIGRSMSKSGNKAASSHSKESIRTWLRLLSCEATIEQQLRTRFREHFPVTLPQFDVLAELQRAGEPLTMSRLSSELMVSNGNITGVVDRLEKAGYVKRGRSKQDRRIQYIALTEAGAKEFQGMARRHEKWLADLFSGLTVSEMGKLQRLLLKARNSVTGAVPA